MNVALRLLMRPSAPPVLTYPQEVLADGPGLYWRLGETAGASVANDSSGNSRPGAYAGTRTLGAAGLLAADADTAMSVAGAGYAWRTRESWMDDDTFTAEAIIKPNSVTSYRAIVSLDGNAASRWWSFYVLNGKLHVFNHGGATLTGFTTLSVGSTYHVALVSAATSTRVYLNGVLDCTPTGAGLGFSLGATNRFIAGASMAGTDTQAFYFDGTLDEIAWYPTPLSAARVLVHAQKAGLA